MEPERRIEKWLRAFAKKRREQAGDPMELHPAMRRQLQDEVARRSAKTTGGKWYLSFRTIWRPRIALALCFAALAMFALMLLPPSKHPQPSTLASADLSRDKFVPAQKTMPALTPPPVSSTAPITDSEGTRAFQDRQQAVSGSLAIAPVRPEPKVENYKPNVLLDDVPRQPGVAEERVAETPTLTGATVASTTPNEMPAFKNDAAANTYSFGNASTLSKDANNQPQPSTLPPPTITAPPGGATLAANRDERTKLKFEKTPATAPAASAAYFDSSKKEIVASAPSVSQLFNRLDMPEARRRTVDASSTPTNLLASFRVEQNGNAMRVVDADGSVYTGAVQVARQGGAPRALAPKNAAGAARYAGTAGTAGELQTAQNYFFRVTGTNHNLKQNVIFSGNFIPFTNASFPTGGFGGSAQTALGAQMEPFLSNSRISGTAVIDNQREIQVDATPAATPASTGVPPNR